MKTLNLFLTLIALLALVSCSESVEEPQEYAPIKLDLKSQEIVDGSNEFGINLFKEVASATGEANVMISSLSVSQALGMTWNGARGATRDEMTEMMGFSVDNNEELNRSNKTVRDALMTADNMIEMDIANSIWYRNTFQVKQEFIDVNKKFYDAEVKSLNFENVAGSKKVINGWVNDKTKGKINEIIDDINPDDVMFLINAVYFKGKWKFKFREDDTVEDAFRYADGHTADVKMISQKTDLEYFEADDYKGVALPYGNGHFRMIVVLPHEDMCLKDMVSDLDGNFLLSRVNSAQKTGVDLKLPKFTFKCDLLLNAPLQELGMKTAFADNADLSGISSSRGLTISKVHHKTFIEVNEEGTESAAVTCVTTSLTSVGSGGSLVLLVVDRPFLFLIQEKDTGAILFMGQVYDPMD